MTNRLGSGINISNVLFKMLTKTEIEEFITRGYVRVDNAFPVEVASQCRELLWKASGCNPEDKTTWTQPVVRIGEMAMKPFVDASNTAVLHEAFDQLVGAGNWIPRQSLGTFPIRFPSQAPANDTGWHVDASFPGDDPVNYLEWRINVKSRGRGLLMLFLFSDTADNDAPTRIRVGSHLDISRVLAPHGDAGLSFMEIAENLAKLPVRTEALATGSAGTVYLCHPFLVHAAQENRGSQPKFMAQPPLHTRQDFSIVPSGDTCAVEAAIKRALAQL
ncbi:phytanoyl-CoA dioxygenase [Chryseolinea sp. T2]|uniref:phytanoyl-CoA dioxygenase n=1 Tax=Chryseolinea sp. T2 TaxID=3129255 RepID=UPI0030777179